MAATREDYFTARLAHRNVLQFSQMQSDTAFGPTRAQQTRGTREERNTEPPRGGSATDERQQERKRDQIPLTHRKPMALFTVFAGIALRFATRASLA